MMGYDVDAKAGLKIAEEKLKDLKPTLTYIMKFKNAVYNDI